MDGAGSRADGAAAAGAVDGCSGRGVCVCVCVAASGAMGRRRPERVRVGVCVGVWACVWACVLLLLLLLLLSIVVAIVVLGCMYDYDQQKKRDDSY